MTRSERLRATAEALAGEPCRLSVATPDLSTYRSASGFTVHVWDGGNAVLVPPAPPRPRPAERRPTPRRA